MDMGGGYKDIVSDMQVVVLMGGLGTRLGLEGTPKAMADINGRPFFDYQMMLLKRWRFHKFLFLVGHRADAIRGYYGDGARWQASIQYSYDGPGQLGTGGALKNAAGLLEDSFLLIYGDSFMDIDYQEAVYRYQEAAQGGQLGVMAIFENDGRYDKSNVSYQEGQPLLYDKACPGSRMRFIDYGVLVLSKKILGWAGGGAASDLSDVLSRLSRQGKLAAQVAAKRFYEIGSPAAMQEFGRYARRRFCTARGAVFFDRDGVINEICFNDDTGQLDSPFRKEDFVYCRGAVEALLAVQGMGYYIFIVTNQPAAAKGKCTVGALYGLNTWLAGDLKGKGVTVEFINVCPHHPSGARGTRAPFLCRPCSCRKPQAGLVTDLLQVYNIDMGHAYMVGDSYTDIIAGHRAGVKTVLLGGLKCDACRRLDGARPDWVVPDISGLAGVLERERYV